METSMKKTSALLVASCALWLGLSGLAQAQTLPRSYVASPDIYQVIAQNDQFKVIAVTWKPGQRDVVHSHPANAVYYLTDCSLRIHAPDGSSRDAQPRAGAAIVQQAIPGHVLENIGSADCRLVMFEPS
jgi:hypothetical protein